MVLTTACTAYGGASLTGLGHIPGDFVHSNGYGVSGDGSVVVGTSASSTTRHAFRWTRAGGMVSIGDGIALDANDDGSVIVGSARWTSTGASEPGGYGVSGDGSVVVGSRISASGLEAFRWTSTGGMVGLSDLPGGEFESYAFDVSRDGAVVVGTGTSASGREAFRWTSAGGMLGLGVLPGHTLSRAFAASGDGSVVVGGSGNSTSEEIAFRWTSTGGMVGLGALPGYSQSVARGVNGDGSVIVGTCQNGVLADTFYWTSDGGMQRLWDILVANGVDPAADGWRREFFGTNGDVLDMDVSLDGTVIVGTGMRNGMVEAFAAVIPEPASLSLLGVSGLALLRRRR
ncbi:MAG TPA: PEP-CTERM sorting domain-containing protein [Tepidisphaeraceae bacterium]|nr:PEP-CTERM sorting domain-containing protein [Tepidisphaeraceae bacterium]